MQIFTAPVNDPDLNNPDFVKVFLAGTIDLGNSEDWQKMLIEKISENFSGKPIKIFNPRRESFPDISDTVEVERQILWELDALNVADIIFFGILGNSKSPITLLELGMMMGKNFKRNQIIVSCPPEFYREQNVRLTLGHEIVAKDNAHLFDTFYDAEQKLFATLAAKFNEPA